MREIHFHESNAFTACSDYEAWFLECLLNVHYDNHESGSYCDRYTLSHVSLEIVLLVEHNNLREPSKGTKSHLFHRRKWTKCTKPLAWLPTGVLYTIH